MELEQASGEEVELLRRRICYKIWRLNETALQDLYNQVKLDNLGQEISIGVNITTNLSISVSPQPSANAPTRRIDLS